MITDNFIKMCEKAKEIQKLWKPRMGDWCADPDHDEGVLASIGSLTATKRWDKWLPTQEQLIEILNTMNGFWQLTHREYQEDKIYILTHFAYYQKSEYINKEIKTVFLQMIMKEKYNKTWTGEKWVKAE